MCFFPGSSFCVSFSYYGSFLYRRTFNAFAMFFNLVAEEFSFNQSTDDKGKTE